MKAPGQVRRHAPTTSHRSPRGGGFQGPGRERSEVRQRPSGGACYKRPVLGLILGHDGLALAHLLAQLGHLRPQGRVLLLQEGRPDGDLILLQARASRTRLAATLFFLRLRQYFSSVGEGSLVGLSSFPRRPPSPLASTPTHLH